MQTKVDEPRLLVELIRFIVSSVRDRREVV